MPKKITNEEFVNKMKMLRPDLTPLEEYVSATTSIKFKCNKCGHVFQNSPSRILGTRNQGCPKCYADSKRFSHEDFLDKAKSNKNVHIVGRYRGTKKDIDVKCVYCGKTFPMRADSVIDGRGHGSCIQKNLEREPKRTQEQFIKDLESINNNIEPLGTYTKTNDRMWFKCRVCGNKWNTLVKHVLYDYSGCPMCNQSKGERKISNYLQRNNIEFIPQHTFENCKDINCLPFDFYIPSINTCIEYDGEQHFREVEYFRYSLEYIQGHDEIKNNYCKNNNIELIRIPYTEFDNLEKILDEFFKNR